MEVIELYIGNINFLNDKYHECGFHINNFPMLIKKDERIVNNPKVRTINIFTSSRYLSQLAYRVKGIKMTRVNQNKCQISFNDEVIEFSLISDLFVLKNDKSVIDLKKELLNYKKRKGLCHYNCIIYLNSFGNKIVTGYVDDSILPNRVIHSWIETDKKVIDYTKNLVINKEDYYRLLNPEILNTVTKEQLNSDIDIIRKMDFLGSKFYCLFRDEILTDIERSNIDLFSESNYEKKLK